MKRFSAAILIENNQLLLGKRSNKRDFYPNVWDFIGGHCEENESFEDAMLREVKEEIAVIPTVYEHFITIDKSPEFVLQIYIVKNWTGEIQNLVLHENELIQWFSFDEAAKLDFPEADYFHILNSLQKLLLQNS